MHIYLILCKIFYSQFEVYLFHVSFYDTNKLLRKKRILSFAELRL